MVLGDVMTGVITRMGGPLAPGGDTPAAIVLRPGGSAANTAAWLGHPCVPVVMVACVGDDALGRDATRALAEQRATPALTVSGAPARLRARRDARDPGRSPPGRQPSAPSIENPGLMMRLMI